MTGGVCTYQDELILVYPFKPVKVAAENIFREVQDEIFR